MSENPGEILNERIRGKRHEGANKLRGMGSTFLRGKIWWIFYSHRGKPYRESSNSIKEADAKKLLKRRLAEVNAGKFIPNENKISFEELKQDLFNDYRVNARRSLKTINYYLEHLGAYFGFDKTVDITPDRVRAYQAHRLGEKASNATVNREVAILGRMLSLAYNAGKLSRKPRFQMLIENNTRQGFLDHAEFVALLGNLPDYLKPIVEFLYLSGWRKGEAQKLIWRDVDLNGKVIRLRIENSKNKEARVLPLTGRLLQLIQDQNRVRRLDCAHVFRNGAKPVGDFRKAWKSACEAAGLQGVIVHDLRRCAARNLSRSGVPEAVAMEITGHKTRSMYRRYRIVDERDLLEAGERLDSYLQAQPQTHQVLRRHSRG